MSLAAWLLDSLKGPLVGGGLVLMLSGAALALARKIPFQILGWLRRHVVVEVEGLDPGLLSQVGTFIGAGELGRRPTRARLRALAVKLGAREVSARELVEARR